MPPTRLPISSPPSRWRLAFVQAAPPDALTRRSPTGCFRARRPGGSLSCSPRTTTSSVTSFAARVPTGSWPAVTCRTSSSTRRAASWDTVAAWAAGSQFGTACAWRNSSPRRSFPVDGSRVSQRETPGRSCVSSCFPPRRTVRRLSARGEGDRHPAGDDLLAALILRPHLELDQVDVVLRRLGKHAASAGHDVREPHERREADTELPDRARARPVGDGLRDEAHREHAVRKDAAHAGRPRERLVLMDRVEVPGGAGVARELDLLDRALDERWELVADRDVLEGDLRVFHRHVRGGSP